MSIARSRLSILAAALFAVACDGSRPADRAADSPAAQPATRPAADSTRQQAVRELVARFGERLQRVSLLAPDSLVAAQLRDAYGGLVTPELLAEWTARPDSAPGRRVSSPWPDRIRVDSLRPADADRVEVVGAVLYVTSVERAGGGRAAAAPVRLEVSRGADGAWRVSRYAEGAATDGA